MTKKFISIIVSIVMCMFGSVVCYAEEADDIVVYHDIAYLTITDHYSEAAHSGSYDVSWTENGRYEKYTIDVRCHFKEELLPTISVEISLSDRNAKETLRHLLGNIKYCSNDLTLISYTGSGTLYCRPDGLLTNGCANSFLTVRNDYEYKYGTYPDHTAIIEFSVNDAQTTPVIDIEVLGVDFNVNTVLSDSTSQYTLIKQLKEENKNLKEQINILSSSVYGDVTGDGAVTVEDSMWTLMYYTEHDVALKTQDSFLDWCIKRKSS